MNRKEEILQQYFGYTHFRDGQEKLIDALLNGQDVLGIMPTGSGKSLCYQVPALMFEGITLVISPLISLMKDQVAALKNAGAAAAFLNSSLSFEQIRTAYKRLHQGAYKIIYVAPERLQTPDFMRALEGLNISMVAVDEAHCISQWGQDFRPSYLKIAEFVDSLPVRPIVSAFTATATQKVAQDIALCLQLQTPVKLITGFDRPNLRFEVRSPKDKISELLQILETRRKQSGIIYCSTRKDVEHVCQILLEHGYPAVKYHAGLTDIERHQNQDAFIFDLNPIIVATNAFGMGIDKSNVSFVIHFNMPKCIEAYYQEAGRAGRDGTEADCILLYSAGDVQTAKFFIQNTSENEELSQTEREEIQQRDFERLDAIIKYCSCDRCLRQFILNYFGQEHMDSCGNCSNCDENFTVQDITEEAHKICACIEQVFHFLGYNLGEGLILKILRGSKVKRLLELRLTQLPAYGTLASCSADRLVSIIHILKNRNILRTNYLYSTLEVLRTLSPEETITMRVRNAPMHSSQAISDAPADTSLLDTLKALRMKLAAAEKVPAYIVFSNSTLEDMAVKQPQTMSQFLNVSGVGKYKADKYGEVFLDTISKAIQARHPGSV